MSKSTNNQDTMIGLDIEYLGQDEAHGSPCPDDHPANSGGFTLHGHRLSSLFRMFKGGALTLTIRYLTQDLGSSCPKYSKFLRFNASGGQQFQTRATT